MPLRLPYLCAAGRRLRGRRPALRPRPRRRRPRALGRYARVAATGTLDMLLLRLLDILAYSDTSVTVSKYVLILNFW